MNIRSYYPLLLLALLPIIWGWLKTRKSIWEERCKQLSVNIKNSSYRVYVPFSIITLLILSLTRPYNGTSEIPFSGKGYDIIVALDVSPSMLAKDIAPNRLEFARRKTFDLVDLISHRSPSTRIGVVLFSGEAYLFCPLTNDMEVLKDYLKSANQDLIAAKGSSILGAVSTSISALSASGASNTSIIMLTDGEDNELAHEELEKLLSIAKTKLYILGIGTDEGAALDFNDEDGKQIISKLNSEALNALPTNDGDYFKAKLGDEDINSIVDKILSEKSSERQIKAISYKEFGFVFLLLALAIIITAPFNIKLRQILPIFLLISHTSLNAYGESPRVGEKKYKNGEYELAKKEFEAALSKDPSDQKLLQALGSAQFKLGDYDGAIESFKKSVELSPNLFDNHYNLGNAYLASSLNQEAIDSYKKALEISPNDIRAQTNKKIAEQRLQEETPTPKPEETPKNEQKDEKNASQDEKAGESNTPKPSPPPRPTPGAKELPKPDENKQDQKMNNKTLQQKEAEQLLNSLPDSPLLLKRKKAENSHPSKQSW